MAEKFNDELLEDLLALQTSINSTINSLNEYTRIMADLQPGAATRRRSAIATSATAAGADASEWLGNNSP